MNIHYTNIYYSLGGKTVNKEKFENTVLAILKASPGLGNIQVRKALCIADAVHNSLHGESITGSRYIKEKFGPVPDNEGYRCLVEMILSDKIINDEIYSGCGTENHYYIAIDPDYTIFTDSQINIINYAAKIAREYRASDLSNRTHDDVYNKTPMREEIPLSEICKPLVSDYETDSFTDEEKEDIKRFFEINADQVFA
jgi:hypothetical protein